MESLDSLYQWLYSKGIYLFDRQLPFSNGATKALTLQLNNSCAWGIYLDKGRMDTIAEEESAVLHEAGHYATGTTHQVSSPWDLVAKHEYKADKWAVQRKLTAQELDDAVAGGCAEMCELAEYFGVTEDFMRKAVCWYTYGNLDVEHYMAF